MAVSTHLGVLQLTVERQQLRCGIIGQTLFDNELVIFAPGVESGSLIGIDELDNAAVEHILVSSLEAQFIEMVSLVALETGVLHLESVDIRIGEGHLISELGIEVLGIEEVASEEGDGAGVLIDQALLVLALAVPGVEQVIQRLQLAT